MSSIEPTVRTRLPRGSLNREVILDAALQTLARPGAGHITMRALAAELGADPTAVYRHFAGKDDLVGALTDRIVGLLDLPDGPTPWRERLEAVGHALHVVLARMPGAIVVLAVSPFTPASLRALDATVASLIAAGLSPELAVEACQTVVLYTIGHAAGASADAAGFWAGMLDGPATAEETPTLTATAELWRAPPADGFAAGLALVLDGVAHRLERA